MDKIFQLYKINFSQILHIVDKTYNSQTNGQINLQLEIGKVNIHNQLSKYHSCTFLQSLSVKHPKNGESNFQIYVC